jgi:hypothetical protein
VSGDDSVKPVKPFFLPPSREASIPNAGREPGAQDGRKARATGRTKQFNPKVTPQFKEAFAEAKALEEDLLGRPLTQAFFLELLLKRYAKDRGAASPPFKLSTAALEGAQAIAAEMNLDLSRALEDAILARCIELGLKPDPNAGNAATRAEAEASQRATKKGRAALKR